MNIFNLILIGLIFISLIVIIVIFGRSLKRVKDVNIVDQNNKLEQKKKNLVIRFFGWIIDVFKKLLVLVAEWSVKKIKKVLHLVHYWLIKIRKGKQENGLVDEIEAKKELIIEEEKNLDMVINEDLAQSEGSDPENEVVQKIELTQEREVILKAEEHLIEEEKSEKEEKESKIIGFFKKRQVKEVDGVDEAAINKEQKYSEESMDELEVNVTVDAEPEEVTEKIGFMEKLKATLSFSKEKQEKQDDMQEGFADQFSDGVVKIEKPIKKPNEEQLIKEVVNSGGVRNGFDQDEELGVDRKILEKKILQKVANDPRNQENYRQLGDLYIKMKNFEDANNAYKFILELSPRDIDAKRKIEKIKLLKRLN